MKTPAPRPVAQTKATPAPPPPPKPPNSGETYAKLAVVAASATFVTARLVDMALIGSSVAAAAGSVVFAGFMVMHSDHEPPINGMQYLAIFAQPKRTVRPTPDSTEIADKAAAGDTEQPDIDLSPIGAIPVPTTTPSSDYVLVSARSDRAWVRAGSKIFAVHPGDVLPNLGKVKEIVWGGGHWTVVGDGGDALLVSGDGIANRKGPSGKPLILDGGGN